MTSSRNKTVLAWLGVAAALIIVFLPLVAMAQAAGGNLDAVGTKVQTLTDQIVKIIRIVAVLAGAFVAYAWMKGAHEAREKTEKWLLGLAILFAATYVVGFFA